MQLFKNLKLFISYFFIISRDIIISIFLITYKSIFGIKSRKLEKAYYNLLSKTFMHLIVFIESIRIIIRSDFIILQQKINKIIFNFPKFSPKVYPFLLNLIIISITVFLIYGVFVNTCQNNLYNFLVLKLGLNCNEKFKLLGSVGALWGGLVLLKQILVSQEQNKLSIISLENSRFNDAVNSLNSGQEVIRLKSVCALYETAKLNKEKRREIFEILITHLRNITTKSAYQRKYSNKPSADVQTIIDFLLTNKEKCNIFKFNKNINLSKSYLKGANFSNSMLGDISFDNANISNTDFSGSFLIKISLISSNIDNSNFSKCIILMSSFQNASSNNTNFKLSALLNSDFINTDLTNSDFTKTFIVACNINNHTNFNKINVTTQLKEKDFEQHSFKTIFGWNSLIYKFAKKLLLEESSDEINSDLWLEDKKKNKNFINYPLIEI